MTAGRKRVWAVARSELAHLRRRPVFWVFVGLVLLMSFGMSSGTMQIGSGNTSVGGKVAWVTSEIALAYQLGTSMILYLFFAVMAAGRSSLRDQESKVLALLRASPLEPREYVAGKLLGVSLAYAAVVVLQVLATMWFNHGLHNSKAHPWIGPWQLGNYLRPMLTLMLPTLALMVTMGLALALRFRRAIAVYLFPVIVFIVLAFFAWSYNPNWLPTSVDTALMVTDPFAMRWLQQTLLAADRGTDFYNHAAIPYDTTFIINRVVVLLALAASVRWVAREADCLWREPASRIAKKNLPRDEKIAVIPLATTPLADLQQTTGVPNWFVGVRTVARFELRTLMRRPGMYLFVPLLLAQVVGNVWGQEGPFGTTIVATSGALAVRTVDVMSVLFCLMMLFYLVETLHRERTHKLDGILFSTSIKTSALVFGKMLSMLLAAMAMLAIVTVAGLAALKLAGEGASGILPLMIVWWLLLLPTFAVWIAFVGAAYAITGHRFATYGVAFAVLAGTIYGVLTREISWVTNWLLWKTLRWSDLSTFEIDRNALLLNRAAMISLAALFLHLAVHHFRRRQVDVVRVASSGGLRARWRSPQRITLLLSVVAALTIGVLHQHVQAGPAGKANTRALQDYRMAHHDTWRTAPKPSLAHVEVAFIFAPEDNAFEVDGTYTVTNHHAFALDRFVLTLGSHFEDVEWTLNGNPITPDTKANLAVVEHHLEPAADCVLGFRFHGRYPTGSGKHGMNADQFIVPSAVVVHNLEATVVPFVGYLDGLGANDDNKTEPEHLYPGFHKARLEPYLGSATAFSTRISITGPADFTFNSVGKLVEQRDVPRGHQVVWESTAKVRFFNVVGGRYEVKRGDGVAVFYHSQHGWNVDDIVATLEGAREHYGRWFGEYGYGELKLTEFPAYATYAQGFPSNITFSEGIGFLADKERSAARSITAHEAAHQWWANMLTPGKGPGGPVLSESLSHYSMLLLTEEMQGEEERIKLTQTLEKRYLTSRRADGERPLVSIDGSREGDTTVIYEKGGLTFWLLMNQLGRKPLLAGLRRFIEKFGDGPDYPAVPDLLAVLREHSVEPVAFDALTEQLFKQVVLPEYRLTEVTKQAVDDGWEVRALLSNIGTGDFRVSIEANIDGKPCAQKDVLVPAASPQSVALTCAHEPHQMVVDPQAHVLQLGRSAARHKW